MLLPSRLKRILRKISLLHKEKESFSLTAAYIFKIFSNKFSLFARHLYGARYTFLPSYRQQRKQRRIEAHAHNKAVLAIRVAGGVGDLLVIARFIRDLQTEAGPFIFDIFCAHPKIAQWIFTNVPGFENTEFDTVMHIGKLRAFYDAELHISQAVTIAYKDKKETPLNQKTFSKIFQAIAYASQELHLYIANQPFLDNGLGRVAVYSNASRRDFLHSMAGIPYGGDQLPIPCNPDALDRLALHGKHWITVHNGFDTNFIVSGQHATKCYPYFDTVLAIIKRARPDLLIIQVGASSSTNLLHADIDLISSTTLEEAAAILKGSMLHLDNESGLVHLSSCLATPSVVVFGPTPSDYFGYPTNTNIDPNFCGGCWWINELWMDRCPRKLESAKCLTTIEPEHIAELFLENLYKIEKIRDLQK